MDGFFLSLFAGRTAFADKLHPDFARARAVVFHEEDALPGAELQPAVGHDQLLRRIGERAFDMGVRVALRMGVRSVFRDGAAQESGEVAAHIRVGVFVDGDACGGMGTEYREDAVARLQFLQTGADQGRDVDDVDALTGSDGIFFHGFAGIFLGNGCIMMAK